MFMLLQQVQCVLDTRTTLDRAYRCTNTNTHDTNTHQWNKRKRQREEKKITLRSLYRSSTQNKHPHAQAHTLTHRKSYSASFSLDEVLHEMFRTEKRFGLVWP